MKLTTRDYDFEVLETSEAGVFTGYASVFNTINAYRERIAAGAFKASLREWKARKQWPAMLWQHDVRQPIGVYLDMREDDRGLYVEGELLFQDIPKAREAYALAKRKAIRGLSIGFITRDDSYDEKEDIRTIKKLDLWEISQVTFAADPDAGITEMRSAFQERVRNNSMPIAEFERLLRDAGFSRAQATAIASHGFKKFLQSESGVPATLSVQDALKIIELAPPVA